jgi:nitroreductase
MELSELENLIKGRRSIRRWEPRAVPVETLLQAIELATWAPNAGNRQNWHFYVIINQSMIATIADAVQRSADQMASWPEAQDFGSTVAEWQSKVAFFRSAPAAIAVAAAQYDSVADQLLAARGPVDSTATQMREWRRVADSRVQSVASAIAYLLLVLHSMGLGAVWMTGPMQAKGEIEQIIRAPAGMDLVAFIPVGYPAECPVSKGRRPVDEVYTVIR